MDNAAIVKYRLHRNGCDRGMLVPPSGPSPNVIVLHGFVAERNGKYSRVITHKAQTIRVLKLQRVRMTLETGTDL